MNFGKAPKGDQLKQQTPTYLVAPNFSIAPPPHGPLDLGTLVDSLDDYYPINQGLKNRIPLNKEQRYSEVKSDVTTSLKETKSGEANILARILGRSLGGNAALGGMRHDEDIYTISRLETVNFYPNREYIDKCLQLRDVKDYMEAAKYKKPVFLITGLKIAWGATISNAHGHVIGHSAEVNVTVPAGPLDLRVGASSQLASGSGVTSAFQKPADFVFGIQVQKLHYKQKYLGRERVLMVERVTRHAVLVDDNEVQVDDEEWKAVEYTLEDLDDDELAGLTSHTVIDAEGHEETWFLPLDTA